MPQHERVQGTPLPPKVSGKPRGELRVRLEKLLWSPAVRTSFPRRPIITLRWWGTDGRDPHPECIVSTSLQRTQTTTITHPIRVDAASFQRYLTDQGSQCRVDVQHRATKQLVGSAHIDMSHLGTGAVQGYYEVVSPSGAVVARLRLHGEMQFSEPTNATPPSLPPPPPRAASPPADPTPAVKSPPKPGPADRTPSEQVGERWRAGWEEAREPSSLPGASSIPGSFPTRRYLPPPVAFPSPTPVPLPAAPAAAAPAPAAAPATGVTLTNMFEKVKRLRDELDQMSQMRTISDYDSSLRAAEQTHVPVRQTDSVPLPLPLHVPYLLNAERASDEGSESEADSDSDVSCYSGLSSHSSVGHGSPGSGPPAAAQHHAPRHQPAPQAYVDAAFPSDCDEVYPVASCAAEAGIRRLLNIRITRLRILPRATGSTEGLWRLRLRYMASPCCAAAPSIGQDPLPHCPPLLPIPAAASHGGAVLRGVTPLNTRLTAYSPSARVVVEIALLPPEAYDAPASLLGVLTLPLSSLPVADATTLSDPLTAEPSVAVAYSASFDVDTEPMRSPDPPEPKRLPEPAAERAADDVQVRSVEVVHTYVADTAEPTATWSEPVAASPAAPPSPPPRTVMLTVLVDRALHLPHVAADGGDGGSEPPTCSVSMRFDTGDEVLRTDTRQRTTAPHWGDAVKVRVPATAGSMVFTVWHNGDDAPRQMGHARVCLAPLHRPRGMGSLAGWYNISAAPGSFSASDTGRRAVTPADVIGQLRIAVEAEEPPHRRFVSPPPPARMSPPPPPGAGTLEAVEGVNNVLDDLQRQLQSRLRSLT
eukprot:TRINITY_DN32276_c0_g1_i1.p1 TRINITY_DN32276_c0_g1~~TRINITY_DN32276_c0_g1_i1.p1  ORF type:complete len:816 (+),score=181.64 TRINITY_DN32276_c0_g1_i1:61-2508(+)